MTRPDCILQPGFKPPSFPDVTCLGSLSPAEVYTIDNPLDWDKGSEWTARADFLSEDAVIVAISLNTLGWKSSLITNRLGNDILGENVVAELRRLGIEGEFVLDPRPESEILVEKALDLIQENNLKSILELGVCLLYTSPSPRDRG